jgi:hypothetical protein
LPPPPPHHFTIPHSYALLSINRFVRSKQTNDKYLVTNIK